MLHRMLAAVALAALFATPVHAGLVTIDFDAFTAGPFTNGVEDGFTLTATDSGIVNFASLVTGFSTPNYITGFDASWGLSLVKTDGSLFEFVSYDGSIGFGTGNPSLTVTGFLGGTQVGSDILTHAQINPALTYTATNLAGIAVDRLRITQSEVNIPVALVDNIVLESDATVPLPATAWFLAAGLGLLGVARRQRETER